MRKSYVLIFFCVTMLLAFYKPIFHSEFTLIAGGDMCAQTYPWFNVAAHWLKKGVLLLWDPYVYGGKPTLGELQLGILYPLNWVIWLFPARAGGINPDGLQFLLILNCLLASLFTYLLARSLGLSKRGSLSAGVIFPLGGYVAHLYGWVNIFSGFVWMPLAFYLFRKALLEEHVRARIRLLLWTGLIVALSFLAGHHAPPIHTGLLMLLFAAFSLARNWKPSDWRGRSFPFVALACAAGMAGLLTVVQWLPSLEWARMVMRWVGVGEPVRWGQKIPYSVLEHTGSLNPQDLLSLLIPYLSTSANLYVGVTVLFLCLLGLLFERRGESSFFRIAFFFYLFVSLGSGSAVHGWVNTFLPGVWFAREVYLYLVPLQLCIALLAGWGLDTLLECLSGVPDRFVSAFVRRSAWTMAVILLCTGIIMVAAHILKNMPWDHPYIRRAAGLSFYLAMLGLGLFFFVSGRIKAQLFSVVVIGLILTDLASQQSANLIPAENIQKRGEPVARIQWKLPPAAEFLKGLRKQEVFRVDNPMRIFPENFGDAWLLDETMGHGATALVDYMDFRGTGWGPTSNASALLNARYFVSRFGPPGMRKVYGEQEAVYLNPRACPRAFVAPRYRSFDRREDILSWIGTPLLAPRETVLVRRADVERLPPAFLREAIREEDDVSSQVRSFRMASEREAEHVTDEEKRRLLYIFHPPWGWSTGDEITLRVRPARPIENCFLLLNYLPVDARASHVQIKVEGAGRAEEIGADLPGLQLGEAEMEIVRHAAVDLGALSVKDYGVSFARTEECPAKIDSVRITSSAPRPEEFDAGEVNVTQIKPNSMRLQAEMRRSAFVVVSEVNYPGWEATVDGKPAPVLTGDYILRAIPVPAGKHEIVLRFRSPTFLWGLAISLVSLGGMALALLLTRPQRSWRP